MYAAGSKLRYKSLMSMCCFLGEFLYAKLWQNHFPYVTALTQAEIQSNHYSNTMKLA